MKKLLNIRRPQAGNYVTKSQLADQLDVSPGTIKSRIQEIEEEIKKGRYAEYAVMRDGQLLAVNYLVWIDYMTYRQRLREKNLRKTVPPFQPKEIEPYAFYESCEAYQDYKEVI